MVCPLYEKYTSERLDRIFGLCLDFIPALSRWKNTGAGCCFRNPAALGVSSEAISPDLVS
jgi:hypothetical protein